MHQGEPDRLTRFKAEAVNIVRYFAEDEPHTMAEAKVEFKRSADTIRDRIDLLSRLLVDGAFSNNPEFEKEMKIAYHKARKNLNSHKSHPENARYATSVRLMRIKMRKELLKSSS